MAVCAAAICSASPPIYKYVDAGGTVHFTDKPDSRRYELVELTPSGLTRSGDHYDPALLARATQYDVIIQAAAESAGVEPNLLRAVIVVESGFNSHAVSKRGAVGLMQLMPATAARFGVSDRYDPRQNVRGGALYLGFLINRFGRNVRLALAAFNAGEDAVDRNAGQIPPFSETLEYVPKVMRIYRALTEQEQRRTTWRNPSALNHGLDPADSQRASARLNLA
ncbi:MAG TPA: lytic transglycosylase domain-containing protein [Steroidobacteraceae bacterium]|nr:lytic transglycosylase domain-containing protein [Steroidobacteraceae bacterium]